MSHCNHLPDLNKITSQLYIHGDDEIGPDYVNLFAPCLYCGELGGAVMVGEVIWSEIGGPGISYIWESGGEGILGYESPRGPHFRRPIQGYSDMPDLDRTSGENPRITLSPGGSRERQVRLQDIQVPDLWSVAQRIKDPEDKKQVLECWHLVDALVKHLK